MNEDEFDAFVRNSVNNVKSSAVSSSSRLAQTWKTIETGLHHEKKIRLLITFSLATAASVIVLFVVLVNTSQPLVSGEKISYKQEEVVMSKITYPIDEDQSIEEEILFLLAKKCEIKKTICYTEEFHQLKFQLNELNEKEKQIQTELRVYGQAPSVLKALTKIRIMKADVLKKLLKI